MYVALARRLANASVLWQKMIHIRDTKRRLACRRQLAQMLPTETEQEMVLLLARDGVGPVADAVRQAALDAGARELRGFGRLSGQIAVLA